MYIYIGQTSHTKSSIINSISSSIPTSSVTRHVHKMMCIASIVIGDQTPFKIDEPNCQTWGIIFIIYQPWKLSIPTTVSRVLKYIPELQKELERLVKKKERLMSKISKQEEDLSMDFMKQMQRKRELQSCSFSYTNKWSRNSYSDFKAKKSWKGFIDWSSKTFEDGGFLVLSASCFQSFERRVFYNLHIKVLCVFLKILNYFIYY